MNLYYATGQIVRHAIVVLVPTPDANAPARAGGSSNISDPFRLNYDIGVVDRHRESLGHVRSLDQRGALLDRHRVVQQAQPLGIAPGTAGPHIEFPAVPRHSDGNSFRCGTSLRLRSNNLSSRQVSAGNQPKPPSTITTLRRGKRSNPPSMTKLVTTVWHEVECPELSST